MKKPALFLIAVFGVTLCVGVLWHITSLWQPPATVVTLPQNSAPAGTANALPAPLAAVQTNATAPHVNKPLRFSAKTTDFSLHKLGTGSGPTLLIIGGIQGDEPGAFSAAALIASHYTITSGSVWVVPDLNLASILERSRGLFGDMNRKFASLDQKDPQLAIVTRIKSVLLDDSVSLILNLHDGSGFYRPTNEGPLRNPNRWGQSIIIDQDEIAAPGFNKLAAMANNAIAHVNKRLLHKDHAYFMRNTNTRLGDTEMEKTLSYYAICNGKPAFGVEASKEFTTEFRSYYHLQVIESFMQQLGITYERNFTLSPAGVLASLNSNLMVGAYDNKVVLPLDNARPQIRMIPFKKGEAPNSQATKPLLTIVPEKGAWRVAYGNRTLTRLQPTPMEFDDSLDTVTMLLDGQEHAVLLGGKVTVQKNFLVNPPQGYRVNAIGAQKETNGTEANISLVQKDFMPSFSVDKAATTYRVEVYKNNAFTGMVLVQFGNVTSASAEPLTATKGPESEFGF